MSCDNYDNAYYGACRPDVPYPSTSAESVPSLIDNLTAALYGTNLTKSVSNGRVVWTLPCNLATGYIPGFPPITDSNGNITEGLLCYILRYLGQSTLAATVVYTGSVQTLTNKTLTSPVVTGGTFSSPALTTPTGIVATDIGGTAGTTGVLGAGITLAATQLTGGALPTNVTVANSNIISGTIAASRLNSIQDFTGKTFTLPSTTTLGASNTAGGLFYGASTTTIGQTAAGTTGKFLISNGTSAPTWAVDHLASDGTTSAAVGYVGEFISATVPTGSSVSLTTATIANITSITLSAGDWELRGQVDYTAALSTVVNVFAQGISTTSATFGGQDTYTQTNTTAGAIVPNVTYDIGAAVRTQRLLLSATTTVYLVCRAVFTTNTLKAYGTIEARRIR